MTYWEIQTRKAIAAYQSRSYQESIQLNKTGLESAFSQFEELFVSDAERAVSAVVVSYLNIAESYEAIQDLQGACIKFTEASDFIMSVCQKGASQSQSLALVNGASQLRREWLLFVGRNREDLPGWMLEPVRAITKTFSKNLEQLH